MRILLVVCDNDSYTHFFPQGAAYLASTLRASGFEVEIYNQDVHHYPDKHLTDYLDNNRFDFIGCGVIGGYYQYRKLLRVSEAVNRSKNRPFYILGGHGPSPDPEYFLRKTQADAVVIGEGEQTIVELLQAVAQHRSLRQVKGIAYRDGNDVVISDRLPVTGCFETRTVRVQISSCLCCPDGDVSLSVISVIEWTRVCGLGVTRP